jgi:hypothetical protein
MALQFHLAAAQMRLWSPAQKLAGLGAVTIGWVIGTLGAWISMPLFKACQTSFLIRHTECRRALYGWIPKFHHYGLWSVAGAMLFAAAFVAVLRWRSGGFQFSKNASYSISNALVPEATASPMTFVPRSLRSSMTSNRSTPSAPSGNISRSNSEKNP